MNETVKIYKIHPEAYMPEYGTDWAACFDIRVSLRTSELVTVYDKNNVKSERRPVRTNDKVLIGLTRGERMLVPTGLIIDLNENQSLRLHPRSGLSLKSGIILANCEGIIDADYTQQLYALMTNVSTSDFIIHDGDRICQGEIVANNRVSFSEVTEKPQQKTNRAGGYGSTGVN